jgi:hypothetical protein
MIISRSDFKSLLNFSYLAIIIFGSHYLLLNYVIVKWPVKESLIIHPFLFLLTIVTILAVKIILKKTKLHVLGYAYLATSLVKMFFVILFLLPYLLNDLPYRKEFILQFFLVYFIYLAAEVSYLVKGLKNND